MAWQNVPSLSDWIEQIGTHVFANGLAKRELAETLNAVVQVFPLLRGSPAGPLEVVTTCEQLEPAEVHPTIPLRILQACVICALQ
mmetsp:Transcript_163103/g.518191  ORF Transcript_163103/g.518191 Transcript_163103/m.518191 type:complete len:85 (-) Transcript_163103:413-667(-)